MSNGKSSLYSNRTKACVYKLQKPLPLHSPPTVELELSLRIFKPRHLVIMKVLVQTQGYLTLGANHRTTNQAKINTFSTCKL